MRYGIASNNIQQQDMRAYSRRIYIFKLKRFCTPA